MKKENKKKIFLIVLLLMLIFFILMNISLKTIFLTTSNAVNATVQLEIMETEYCGDGICNEDETCSSCPEDCGVCEEEEEDEDDGGGGGGGVVIAPSDSYFVDKELIKVVMRLGETLDVSFRITNNCTKDLNFELENKMENYLIISQPNFTLNAGNQKEIFLKFFTTSKTEPGVYTGKFNINCNGKTKEIPIILEIESKEVLFDVDLDVPISYKEVYPGELIVLQFTIFNLGKIGKVEVNVEYFIKNFDGETILSDSDIISVGEQISFSRTLRIPYNLELGSYVATAQVRYDYFVGTSSDTFEVIRKKGYLPYYFLLAFLIFLLILLIRKLIKTFGKYRKEREEANTSQ
jgi:uncharacterized membrane protein